MNKFIMGLVVASGLLISPVANAATFSAQQVETIVVLLQAFGYSAEDVAGIRAALRLSVEEEITNNNEVIMEEPVLGAQSDFEVNVDVAIANNTAVIKVSGDYDRSKETVVATNGRTPVGTGFTPGDKEFVIAELTPGTYTWEVVAVKDGVEKTERGEFVVE